MIRLLTAALILASAVPALACDYNKSASTAPQSRTVASQPANGHAAPAASSSHKQS